MASSGALGTSNKYVNYRIDVSSGSGSVSGNYTPVTVKVFVYRTNTGYTTYGTGTIWCKINGTTYSAGITSSQKITNSGITLFSKTVNIPHNADGTKNLSVTSWLSIPGAGLSSSEQGFSFALPTIPRATTPALSPVSQVMGGVIDISLPRASGSFTHNVTYKFGTKTGTIATGAGTSASFVIPQSFMEEVTDSASRTGTINVATYNGTSLIGNKSVDFTATVPENVVPVINSVDVVEAVEGIAEKFGTFVQDKSKFRVITEAVGAQGSTISSYAVEVLGISYSGKEAVTNEITECGTVIVKATVKDSRGRIASVIRNVIVTEYEAPTISKFAVIRAKTDGTEDPDGEYANCDVIFHISPILDKNEKSYMIECRRTGDEAWQIVKSGSIYDHEGTIISADAVLSSDYTHTVRLTVTDYFTSVTAEVNLGTGAPIVDFRYTGKGMAIGKVSEEDYLEIAMAAKFLNRVILRQNDGTNIDLLDKLIELSRKAVEHEYMHLKLTKITAHAAYQAIEFDQINNHSECFEFTPDYKIKVKGTHRVRVVFYAGGSASNGRIWSTIIHKRGDTTLNTKDAIGYGSYVSVCTEMITTVADGDYIYLYTIEASRLRDGGVGCYAYIEKLT